MPAPPALQRFAEDELLLAPALGQSILEETVASIVKNEVSMRPSERSDAIALQFGVRQQHVQMVTAFAQSMREQVLEALNGRPSEIAPAAAAASRRGVLELQLVDDGAVTAEVEISHCVDAIKGVAEFELRELETFTSALAGDMQVSRGHNPFRPHVVAKALWAAAQCLSLPQPQRVSFMRFSSPAAAKAMRKAYASACQRLEDSGVEPAVYSTVIIPPGAKVTRQDWTLTEDALRSIASGLAAVPSALGASGRIPPAAAPATSLSGLEPAAPAPAPPTASLPPAAAPAHASMASAGGAAENYLSLLNRVIDTMVADPKLVPRTRMAITRLRGALGMLAQQDRTLLDSDDHPAWRFIDRIAFLPDILPEPPDPARLQADQMVNGLIDHVSGASQVTPELFRWAQIRLLALERKRVLTLAETEAAQIAKLQVSEQKALDEGSIGAAGDSTAGTLEIDTIPAALMETAGDASLPGQDATAWMEQLKPGDYALLFLKGNWKSAVLVWHGPMREMWLWADCRSSTRWPMRRSALAKLHAARLALAHQPRSLARQAARAISQQITKARQG